MIIQHKACPRNPVTNFADPVRFDKPVTPGNTIIVAGFGGCNPLLPYPGNCNSVSDNVGDAFQTAMIVPYYNGVPLWYALDVKGGETTIQFAKNSVWLAIMAEYPPSSGLEKAVMNHYALNNLDQPLGSSNDLGWAGPLETSEESELLVGWGFSGARHQVGMPKPGPGFTVREFVEGGFVMEDAVTNSEGLYIGSVEFPGYGHWNFGLAAFKMKGKP